MHRTLCAFTDSLLEKFLEKNTGTGLRVIFNSNKLSMLEVLSISRSISQLVIIEISVWFFPTD